MILFLVFLTYLVVLSYIILKIIYIWHPNDNVFTLKTFEKMHFIAKLYLIPIFLLKIILQQNIRPIYIIICSFLASSNFVFIQHTCDNQLCLLLFILCITNTLILFQILIVDICMIVILFFKFSKFILLFRIFPS